MTTLWLKFPDEALFTARFSEADQRVLDDVFSLSPQSPFMRALALIGLNPPAPDTHMIYWHHALPYFNWSALVRIISGGTIHARKTLGDGYAFGHSYAPKHLWALMRGYWNMTRFLAQPQNDADMLAQSIGLGFIMQSLVLRLGTHVDMMPAWLASPATTPKQYRPVLGEIQRIQLRRTQLSHVWGALFPNAGTANDTAGAPAYFWDDAIPPHIPPPAPEQKTKGVSVCAGVVTGIAMAVRDMRDAGRIKALKGQLNAPVILVFRYARPETTELFTLADGMVFCEGGVLSHACTIAREYNKPAITQMGQSFFDGIEAAVAPVWVTMDGAIGTLTPL